jgi:predicted TIM-barrel fold metal-dependent hydrolase
MIIDSHVHLLPRRVRENRSVFLSKDRAFGAVYDSPKAKLVSDRDILDYLDGAGIDRAVVFGFPWEDHDVVRENNDEVWDFHDRHPDRIIPYAVLSPSGGDRAYSEAARTIGCGFSGIGELAMYHGGWSLSDFEALKPNLELAATAQVPVLIHVNEPVGHHYPGKIPVDFKGLLHIIEAYPDVDFILAHWGGGVFVYALMPEVRKILARTFLDTAASPYLYSSDIFKAATMIMGPEKILFGSDFPLLRLERYLKELDRAGLDGEVRNGILGANVERLIARKDTARSAR